MWERRYTKAMAFQDVFDEGEPVYGSEPEPWQPPPRCPQCHGNQTRFMTLNYEVSVYACDMCGIQFETEG